MNTTIDQDDEETILQSSHREWAENQEREQQDRDERAVEQFLRLKLFNRPVRQVAQWPGS